MKFVTNLFTYLNESDYYLCATEQNFILQHCGKTQYKTIIVNMGIINMGVINIQKRI